MLRNTRESWGGAARLLHWGMALLVFIQFALGWTAVEWRLSPLKLNLFVWHKSIGILILVLLVVRIGWRLANPTPATAAAMPLWERRTAYLSHLLLYLLLVAMPLSGWVVSSASGVPFQVFWLFPLPEIAAPAKETADGAAAIHLTLFVVLALLLIVHIGAALRHHYVKRDDVLVRMLSSTRRPR
jgi:cytochrome b561